MSEFTYTYSKSGDFSSGLAAGQFATEVENSSIGTNFLRVDTNGDVVDVVFSVALTSPQQTTLDGLVAAHVPSPKNFLVDVPGTVDISSSLADSQAVIIRASNVVGGIDIDAGLGGIDINSGNVFSLFTDALISISNTSGNIELDSAGLIDLNSQSGINIGNDNVVAPVNIGTSTSERAITIGNDTTTSSLVLRSGTGNITAVSTGVVTLDSTGATTIDAGGVLELNSDGGDISIGNDADNFNMNIGTSGSRIINIGNTNNSSAVNIFSGSFGLTVGNDASGGEIQIAAAANQKVVKVGNSTGFSKLYNRWGSGGFISHQSAEASLSDADVTLDVWMLIAQIITINPSVSRTLTLPTAAGMVSGVGGVEVDDAIDFRIINLGANASDPDAILAMGTGGTAVGYMSVDPRTNNAGTYFNAGVGIFRLRFTNVTASSEAYTVYRIG